MDVVDDLHKALLSTREASSGKITLVVAPPRNKKNALALAKRIKKARERAGYSRDQLAELMKVHRNTIANWESPSEPTWPGRYLSRLAKLLNVEEVWLLHGDEVIPEAQISEVLTRLQKTDQETLVVLTELRDVVRELAQQIRPLTEAR